MNPAKPSRLPDANDHSHRELLGQILLRNPGKRITITYQNGSWVRILAPSTSVEVIQLQADVLAIMDHQGKRIVFPLQFIRHISVH